jgi:translation elongation factor EF-1alpha
MSRIKNMIAGASQADVALLLVPSDGYFRPSLEKGNTKSNRLEGQTRQHARILKDLGIKQLIVGVSRIDCAPFSYQSVPLRR